MARVKLFVNGTKRTFLESTVSKEGDRGVDQAKFVLPANVNINTNDCIEYIQDIVNLNDLKLYYAFDGVLGDESGFNHNAVGFSNIPSYKSKWAFECNLLDSGLGNNTLVVCCCGTVSYCTGKVECKALKFDGCTTVSTVCAESCYDTEHYNKFSVSGWVRFSSVASDQGIIVKSNDLSTGVGYKLYLCSSNNRIHFTLGDGTTAFTVNSTSCSITTCMWYHLTATFDGTSNRNGMKIYVDGECDTNGNSSAAICCTIRNNVELTIGGESDGGSKITCGGLIDDVYVFKDKELTLNQIRRLYHDGSLTYNSAGKWGHSVQFDGCSGYFSTCDSSDFDLCGTFELVWWMKASNSCSARTIFHKTSNGMDGIDFEINACCKAVFRLGCTTLTSCTDVADCVFHQIRVRRDACNSVELYICNTKEDCGTDCADVTTCVDLTFGRNHSSAQYFNGEIDSFRWYKGTLNTADISTLFTKSNPVNIMKFGGNVTKVEKTIKTKTVMTQSYGKVLGETEVIPQSYECKSPEFIVQDLLINNTSLIVTPYPASSGIVIKKYLADGKLFDLIDDLISLIGATFYTDGLNVIHIQPKQFTLKTNTFTHGNNTRVWETKFDDTELVNELIVLGENKRYQEIQLASGNGSNKCFTLNEAAVSVRVEHPVCTELIPEVQYSLDTLGKTITFTAAPASGCCNIRFDYEYEIPLYIKGRKQTSIDDNGLHSKRLVLPWIRERTDGVRFIAGYLNRYSDVRKNLRIEHPTLVSSLRENDVINVVNSIKGINTTFVIKSIKFEYPKFLTTIEVGEYSFSDFEYDKQVSQKIHDLEGAVSTIKELRGFETISEPLNLCDSVVVNANIEALETLVFCDTMNVTEIFDAVYDCSCTTYDDNDAYV